MFRKEILRTVCPCSWRDSASSMFPIPAVHVQRRHGCDPQVPRNPPPFVVAVAASRGPDPTGSVRLAGSVSAGAADVTFLEDDYGREPATLSMWQP
jgi:hypothetical protein